MKKDKLNKRVIISCIVVGIVMLAAIILVFVLQQEPVVESYDADYSCDVGFEGLRVKRTMEALGLGDGIGMGGAYYSEDTAAAVSLFQKENGLDPTGKVDMDTWQKMGYSEEEWDLCGNYRSEDRTEEGMDREEKIEIMIERAYEYLNDPYVIGASGPTGSEYGLDCSGIVIQALFAAGVTMDDINPVTHAHPGHEYESRNIWSADYFTVVDYEERQRGDLIFYEDDYGVLNHVSIYLGDDKVIESWPPMVMVSDVTAPYHVHITGVKRIFP